jgi:hypothetical protein
MTKASREKSTVAGGGTVFAGGGSKAKDGQARVKQRPPKSQGTFERFGIVRMELCWSDLGPS